MFQIRTATKYEKHCVPGAGGKGNRLEGSGNKSTCEGAGRLVQGDETAMENGSRTADGDPRPARTSSREQQSSFTRQQFLLFTSLVTAGVFLSMLTTTLPCVSYDADSSPDSISHELVSCEIGGHLRAVIEWIPAAMLLMKFRTSISVRCSLACFVSCTFSGKHDHVLPSRILIVL